MTIHFNKEIYPVQAIKLAIKAYKGIAVFTITDQKHSITVNLNTKKNTKEPLPNLMNEFCNYVLSEIRS